MEENNTNNSPNSVVSDIKSNTVKIPTNNIADNIHNVQKSTIIFTSAIIVLLIFVVWQQQQINQIRNGSFNVAPNISSNVNTNGVIQTSTFNQAEAIRESLLSSKVISGTIISLTTNEMVIKVKLVDLSLLDTFDFKKSQTLPTLDKNLTIKITEDTIISGGKLVVGGEVFNIKTKENIYGNETLTAVSMNIMSSLKTNSSTVE